MRRWVAVGLVFLISLTLPGGTRAADAPYEIPVILAITGPFALLGRDINDALPPLQEYINRTGDIGGRPIRFDVQDDQTNPQLAVQLATAIAAKHPVFILGPLPTANCNAVLPLAKDGPVVYCLTPGVAPAAGSFGFTTSFSADDLVVGSVRYMRERGWQKIGLLISTDASGQAGEHALDLAFALPENRDVTVVAREHFNVTDLSVTAQLSRIKAAGAQALVAWQNGAPTATVLRGANEVGLNLPILTSTGNATYQQMHELAALMPRELLFPGVPAMAPTVIRDRGARAAVDVFQRGLLARRIRPEYVHTVVWDPALLLVSAMRKLGAGATPAQVRDYLVNLQGWTGINGTYDFKKYPQRGLGPGTAVIVRWDAARDDFVPVSALGGSPLK
jgi:branched-chain amino acid transport system substrate-binding protein